MYSLVICGGTFDLLHNGHKKFLQDALGLSDKVLLGITSDQYIERLKSERIEDFEIRKKAVLDFLKSIGAEDRVEIISIDAAEEPLLENKYQPEAIVVTPQTQSTAEEINEKRKSIGLRPLEIIVIEMKKAEDGNLISSTRIRNGEINREGRVYVRSGWKNATLHLPETLRPELSKPFGKVLDSIPGNLDPSKTIAIGDITTQMFNQKNIGQFLSIVDFKVHREKKFDRLSQLGFENNIQTINVKNPPGSVTWDLFETIRSAFKSRDRKIIQVSGEEDLAVLPGVLCSPLGFVIYYGQPNEGLVEVKVTEETKKRAFDLANKFELSK